ncbi:MAG: cyclic peptide export ABC transporter [Longimicrobiaceae bacterium]
MKLLFVLLRRSPLLVVLAIAAGVVSGASNAGLLALMNRAIHTTQPWTHRTLVLQFLALCLILPFARGFSTFIITTLGQNTILELRTQLSRRILAAPLQKLEEIGSHRLLAALTQDVNVIVMTMTSLPQLFVHGAMVTGSLIYLGWLSWKVLVIVLGFMLVGVVTYQIPMMRAQAYQRKARDEADTLFGHFRAITNGYKELKLHFPRQDGLISGLDTTGKVLKRFTVTASTIYSAAAGWGQLVIFMMIGSIIFLVPSFEVVGLETMTGYALVLLYMMTPLEVMLGVIPEMSRAQVSLRKIDDLGLSLDDARGPVPRLPGAPVPEQRTEWNTLEMAGVTHAYHREGEEEPFTLGPIDMTINRGETVFLVGGNGSGKTTLAKLLLGLYVPESGELRFDGRAVTDANRADYLHQFAVVFSDFYLFDSLLGMESPEMDALATRFLSELRLAHKVRVEGGKLSTTALSQGQRKRLALLVAYLEDRPIYLFDEWAADQDPLFKEVFYLQLLPELKSRGKTCVVISHDDHYYGVADRIIKLDSGQIEYDGSPESFQYRPVGVPLPLASAQAQEA